MRVVMYLGGELVYDIFVRGSVFIFLRDVMRTYVSFLFFLCLDTLSSFTLVL